jgi:hypothetical protein
MLLNVADDRYNKIDPIQINISKYTYVSINKSVIPYVSKEEIMFYSITLVLAGIKYSFDYDSVTSRDEWYKKLMQIINQELR